MNKEASSINHACKIELNVIYDQVITET